jgi:hypothetical protein
MGYLRVAVEHRHILLTGFIWAISALAGSASADANLAAGETRLPSGVIVRFDDPASSAEEVKSKLKEKFGATAEEAKKAFDAIKSAALAERYQFKIEIVNALKYTTQPICDEYVRYVFKPYSTRLPSSLKEVVINVSYLHDSRYEEKCIYKVAQGPKILRADGSTLPDIALEKVQLGESDTVSIASVSETNEVYFHRPVTDILISVPFAITNIIDLAPYLTRAAKKLYSAPEYKGTIVNFVAVENSAREDIGSLPNLKVMAFQTVSGAVVFLEDIKFQSSLIGGKEYEFVSVLAWNPNLTNAAAAGANSEAYNNYIREGIINDSAELFNAAGRYAAEAFKVSQVVISYQAVSPGNGFRFSLPVTFEFDNGAWRIANKHN